MKKVQFTAALLALMLALGGCSGTTVGESQSAQSSQSITVGESQEEQDEQVLSAERIPTELEGEGVFAHKGDRIQTQVWPMVVRYDDGETTATVDLLLTEIQGSDKPLLYRKAEGGTVELTASNYQQELEGEPVYRYTFQKQGEQLILSGIRQVGVLAEGAAGVDDAALPLEEQGPQLQTPERVMISSEDMQHQLDLQKEYEESTAVEYLMELLGQAQQVSSAAASQVLAGNGSRTLTMTLGYTEGQEVVLNVMSQGYLPGVEESYMTFSLGSKQFVLPQESYADFTNCINTCRLAQ